MADGDSTGPGGGDPPSAWSRPWSAWSRPSRRTWRSSASRRSGCRATRRPSPCSSAPASCARRSSSPCGSSTTPRSSSSRRCGATSTPRSSTAWPAPRSASRSTPSGGCVSTSPIPPTTRTTLRDSRRLPRTPPRPSPRSSRTRAPSRTTRGSPTTATRTRWWCRAPCVQLIDLTTPPDDPAAEFFPDLAIDLSRGNFHGVPAASFEPEGSFRAVGADFRGATVTDWDLSAADESHPRERLLHVRQPAGVRPRYGRRLGRRLHRGQPAGRRPVRGAEPHPGAAPRCARGGRDRAPVGHRHRPGEAGASPRSARPSSPPPRCRDLMDRMTNLLSGAGYSRRDPVPGGVASLDHPALAARAARPSSEPAGSGPHRSTGRTGRHAEGRRDRSQQHLVDGELRRRGAALGEPVERAEVAGRGEAGDREARERRLEPG